MSIKLGHDYNFGNGLEINAGKVQVKTKDTESISFTVTDEGVSAQYIGNTNEVDTSNFITNVKHNETDNSLEFTRSSGNVVVTLPKPEVDVHLSGLEFEQDKLKATLSDGSTKEVQFTAELIVSSLENAPEDVKKRLANILLPNFIRGEEVQDLNGVTKGYLVKA